MLKQGEGEMTILWMDKEHTGNLHSESEHASMPIISLDSKYSRDATTPPYIQLQKENVAQLHQVKKPWFWL